jgi:hypothetical protein
MKESNSAIFWEGRDFGPAWEGVVVHSDFDHEEWTKYRIDTDDDAMFHVWVGKRNDPGVFTKRRTGPLSKPFDCLCQAKRACEAHHA